MALYTNPYLNTDSLEVIATLVRLKFRAVFVLNIIESIIKDHRAFKCLRVSIFYS